MVKWKILQWKRIFQLKRSKSILLSTCFIAEIRSVSLKLNIIFFSELYKRRLFAETDRVIPGKAVVMFKNFPHQLKMMTV